MRLAIVLLMIGFSVFGQEPKLPPVSIQRDEAKIALMDEFIIISNYENSIREYVKDYLWLHSEELKITASQKEQVKKIFDYKVFASYITYSSLNTVENDKISKLIDFYKSIDGGLDKEQSIFLTSYYYSNLLNENILMYIEHTKNKTK